MHAGDAPAVAGDLNAASIQDIIGVEPTVKNGVVKATVAREATMRGARFGGSMGLTTWAAFTGTNARAAIDGDFEEPAYYFTHFWAKGSAADLARGFRSALDAQRDLKRSGAH